MADLREYTIQYNVVANINEASESLRAFSEMMENSSAHAKAMSQSMKRIRDDQKELMKSFGKAFDMRTPMMQMEAFQKSAAAMVTNIAKSFSSLASGDMKAFKNSIDALSTEGFSKMSRTWGTMSGRISKDLKEISKDAENYEKILKKQEAYYKGAERLLDRIGSNTMPSSKKGIRSALGKQALSIYETLSGSGKVDANAVRAYMKTLEEQMDENGKKFAQKKREYNKKIAEGLQGVVGEPIKYTRGLDLTGNFASQAEHLKTATNALNRLGRLREKMLEKGLGKGKNKDMFSFAIKLTGVPEAERNITRLIAKLGELRSAANIPLQLIPQSQLNGNTKIRQVAQPAGSARPTASFGARRTVVEMMNGIRSAAGTEGVTEFTSKLARGLIEIPASIRPIGKALEPILADGLIERVINASRKVPGEVLIDGVVDFVKSAKKVAGEVGVNGVVEFVKGAKKVLGEIGVDGIVRTAKVAEGVVASVNAEAIIQGPAKINDGKPVRIEAEVFPNMAKLEERLAKVKPGKPIPVQIRPEWKKDKDGKTALEKWKTRIPPVDLKLNTEPATEQFNKFIAHIRKFKEITLNLNARANAKFTTPAQGGTTTQPASAGVGGTTVQPTAGRTPPTGRRGVQGVGSRVGRASAYPLVGNTSFGVQTPAFVSMAKGMAGMMGIGAVFGLISDAMNQAVEYQNAMTSVRSILESNKRYTGYTPKNFRDMELNIRRVGMDTKFTAPEVAGAARFMAMAGLSVDQINNSIRPIADVALIGDNDLETTADKITNIQTAFKLGKDPQSMRKLADNLTTTFTRFNTDMMMTAEAMQYAAPVASAAGLGIEDTLAMIGVMGNAGIQSSMAGTTLRMAMQNIIKPNKNQRKLWDKLGIARLNADGSPRNIVDVLTELREKTSDAQLMEVVSNLFRTTSMAGTVQIVRNLDLLKSAREDMILGNDSGLSSKLSAEKQNTIKGLWAQVTSAFTEDNVLMFEKFQSKLKEMLINIRDYLKSPEAIQNLEHIMELIKTMGSAFGSVVRVWMNLYNTFPGTVKALMVIQFALSQIGMLFNPIVGMFRVARNIGNYLGFSAAAGGAVSGGAGVAGIAGAEVMSRYARRYGTMAALGKGFTTSFTAARTAGTLSLTGIAGAGMSGLGTLLGSLLSPIGLTLAGIATAVASIAVIKKNERDTLYKYQRKSSENSKYLENARAIVSGGISNEMFENGLATGATASVGNILSTVNNELKPGYYKVNPQFRHTKGYSHIFMSDIRRRYTGGTKTFVDDMYKQFVKPALGMSESDFYDGMLFGFNEDYSGLSSLASRKNTAGTSSLAMMLLQGVAPSNLSRTPTDLSGSQYYDSSYAAKIAAVSAVRLMAANSPEFRKGEAKIAGMFSSASGISDIEKRKDAFANAMIDANKFINSLAPTGKETRVAGLDLKTIGDLRASDLAQSFEYRQGLQSSLKSMLTDKNNVTMAPYLALMELDNTAVNEVSKRIEIMSQITKMVEFQLPDANGVMQKIRMQFDNGKASFENYMAILDAFNIQTGRDFNTFFNMVYRSQLKMLENPIFAGMFSGKDAVTMALNKVGITTGARLDEKTVKQYEPIARGYAAAHGIDWNWWNGAGKNGKRIWTNMKDFTDIMNWSVTGGSESNDKITPIKGNVGNKLTNNGGSGTGTSSPYNPDQSGYANHYQRSAARPTQINFNIQNLVNIDKTEFKSVEEQEILSKLEFVVSQASTQLAATAAAQLSALGSTGGDTQDVG